MAPPATTANWPRVGSLLVERRRQIDPRYRRRTVFCDERALNYRLVYDLEAHKRENFTPGTLRDFELAYQLVPGSLARTLAGGELEPLQPAVPDAAPRLPEDAEIDPDAEIEAIICANPLLVKIWHLTDGDGNPLDRDQRLAMLKVALTPVPGETRKRGAG